ncbi:unnamed protein product [Discula destructiva]
MALLRALALALLALTTTVTAVAPSLPLVTSSRWILDSTGARVKLRCINWAGHMETHVPEGLHRNSIANITSFIAGAGFNCVRLTYSIDWALNPTELVADAFAKAVTLAGVPEHQDAMTAIYDAAVVHNPSLQSATVRDVYGQVIAGLWENGVMTILDNHVSRAGWCCNLTDGNGWWNDAAGAEAADSRWFNTSEWLAGLEAVAEWSTTQPGVVGMSLRNELRQSVLQTLGGSYEDDWYTYISRAAKLVHAANPDVLVIVGGASSATDLSFVADRGLDFTPWAGKHVWEMHAYSFTVTFKVALGNCALEKAAYGYYDGFVLTQGKNYTAPLILSEFGVAMTGGSAETGLSSDDAAYLDCLVGYMEGNDAEWALWAIQGSYYIRNGVLDYNETWGVYDFEWTGWRNPGFPPLLKSMWNATQGP